MRIILVYRIFLNSNVSGIFKGIEIKRVEIKNVGFMDMCCEYITEKKSYFRMKFS